MAQTRLPVAELVPFLREKLETRIEIKDKTKWRSGIPLVFGEMLLSATGEPYQGFLTPCGPVQTEDSSPKTVWRMVAPEPGDHRT